MRIILSQGHAIGNCRIIKGKDTRYKLYWSGNDKGTAGVGVFVAEEWIEKVFEVQRVSDRILLVKLIVGQRVVTLLSVYAPQKSCHVSSAVGSHGRTSMLTTLLS